MNQKKKYTEEEKLQIINEAKTSGNITATAKRYSLSDSSIHGWMRKFEVNKPTKKTISKADQQEIKRLKRQLADAQLENSILKDLVKKTVQVWTNENSSLSNTSPEILLKQKY
jgi:transposase-like protein